MSTAKRCSICWDSRAPVHMGEGPATGRNIIGEVSKTQPALGNRNPIQSTTICSAGEENHSTMRMYP